MGHTGLQLRCVIKQHSGKVDLRRSNESHAVTYTLSVGGRAWRRN